MLWEYWIYVCVWVWECVCVCVWGTLVSRSKLLQNNAVEWYCLETGHRTFWIERWKQVNLRTFSTSALDGGQWSTERIRGFNPWKKPLNSIKQETGWGPRTCQHLSEKRKISRRVWNHTTFFHCPVYNLVARKYHLLQPSLYLTRKRYVDHSVCTIPSERGRRECKESSTCS